MMQYCVLSAYGGRNIGHFLSNLRSLKNVPKYSLTQTAAHVGVPHDTHILFVQAAVPAPTCPAQAPGGHPLSGWLEAFGGPVLASGGPSSGSFSPQGGPPGQKLRVYMHQEARWGVQTVG